MKSPLVSYSSSDEDQPTKKLLPQLSNDLKPLTPVDDPSLHQGRVRTIPHVEGQFASHIYINLVPSRKLLRLLHKIIAQAQTTLPQLHSLLKVPLHISLSRPVFLRAHQREDLRREVKRVAATCAAFDASLVQLTSFTNDEKTRAFLSIEVGAGHTQLKALSEALAPFLRSLRQQPYHSTPRYHTSIGWALLSTPSDQEKSPQHPEPLSTKPQNTFQSISSFPPDFVKSLQEEFGDTIPTLGCFRVEAVSLKIGKDIQDFNLA